jgi:hypothetical protein
MPDEKPIIDPEKIADYVRSARIVYGFDDDQRVPGEIDNPPTVVQTVYGAKVRAWLPVAALGRGIELDEQRAVKTTPSGKSWRGYGCRSRTKTWLKGGRPVRRRGLALRRLARSISAARR